MIKRFLPVFKLYGLCNGCALPISDTTRAAKIFAIGKVSDTCYDIADRSIEKFIDSLLV